MESITAAMTALLNDPVVVKVGYFVVSAAIAVIVVRALQLVASRSIADSNARYRVRKFIGFFGYVIVALVLLSAFSEKIGQLSVIFGVAG
ncbi:MAG: mechanosensitive ion channel family protein, partial [Nitrospira sp.]|nr:mechanosensitive ion channel family protein [Nitrospira sp.]